MRKSYDYLYFSVITVIAKERFIRNLRENCKDIHQNLHLDSRETVDIDFS